MASGAQAAVGTAVTPRRPPHFLADLYTFDWTAAHLRLPLVSAAAVALCVAVGLLSGHPGGALVAGGGAFTIGFGANQRVRDSRIWPMILAALSMAALTLVGTLAGHRGWGLVVASGLAAFGYGLLTVRHAGLAWVGQQASISLFVASAFPSGPRPALVRAGLILGGGALQIVVTSVGLRVLPELRQDLLVFPRTLYLNLYAQRREFLLRLRKLPQALPAPDRRTAVVYGLRLMMTVAVASEVYRRLGIQSGYWIPMTALLVQKPALFETFERALLRVGGTVAGATVATLIAVHLQLGLWTLGSLAVTFAFGCYVTTSVNYALFTACTTSYIVFLLGLNALPGPLIAHRRAWCTALGAGIALAIHVDALWRHQRTGTGT